MKTTKRIKVKTRNITHYVYVPSDEERQAVATEQTETKTTKKRKSGGK